MYSDDARSSSDWSIEDYPRTSHCQVCPRREPPGRGLHFRIYSRRQLDDADVDNAVLDPRVV